MTLISLRVPLSGSLSQGLSLRVSLSQGLSLSLSLSLSLRVSLSQSLSLSKLKFSNSKSQNIIQSDTQKLKAKKVQILLEETLPSPAIIATTIDVDVEELCTRTVTSTPIMSPAIGLLSILFSENALPAARPPSRRNAELKKLSEQMNK